MIMNDDIEEKKERVKIIKKKLGQKLIALIAADLSCFDF